MRFDYDLTPGGIVVATRAGVNAPALLAHKDAITIPQGATWYLIVHLVSGDASLAAWPLASGFTATLTARRNRGDEDELFEVECQLADTVPNIIATMTPEQTAALDFTGGVCDLDLTYTDDGSVMRVLTGPIRLERAA